MINEIHCKAENGRRVIKPLTHSIWQIRPLFPPVKMECGWNFSISGLKMMVKSGLEKNSFEIPPCAHHY